MQSLVILPADQKDVGSQRFFLGPELITQQSLKLKSVVLVKAGNKQYICTCWPRHDSSDKYVNVDYTVELNHVAEVVDLSMRSPLATVQSVQCCTAVELTVDIVMQRASDYNVPDLTSHVQLILSRLYVCHDCTVKACVTPLGKLFGVRDIFVKSCRSADISDSSPIVCNITRDTKININRVVSAEWFDLRPMNIKCFGGLKRICDELRELASLVLLKSQSPKSDVMLSVSKCLLLKGPAGCGKSLVVASVAKSCNAALLVRSASELFGSRMGEGEEKIGEVFATARRLALQGPCILHIRDIDVICVGKSSHRLVARLAQVLDEVTSLERVSEHLVVVATTNRPTLVSSCLRRGCRFDKELVIGIPDESERGDMLSHLAANTGYSVSDEVLQSVATATTGFVGSDLEALCAEARKSAVVVEDGMPVLSINDFLRAMHVVVPTSRKGSDVFIRPQPSLSWDSVGGLVDVKTQLQQATEWPLRHAEVFQRLGVPAPKGVLLFGPPGCAKTSLARAVATTSGLAFLTISGAQVYSPYVGDAEKVISEVFSQARSAAPAVLFIDEIDAVVGKRGAGDSVGGGAHERVLATLLNEMDGVGVRHDSGFTSRAHSFATAAAAGHSHQATMMLGETNTKMSQATSAVSNARVIVVGATNRPDMLDDAILRPGRLDRIIYVPPPSEQERLAILKVHTRRMPLDDDVDLASLASRTELWTGADLENLCREAALCALSQDSINAQCVCQRHFKVALTRCRSSLTADDMKKYSQLATHMKACVRPPSKAIAVET